MRDDLHKTVSLEKSWRTVLRRLSHDKLTPNLLAPYIAQTVQKELFGERDSGWQHIEQALCHQEGDLFDCKQDKIITQLSQIHDTNLTIRARFCCEIAIGVVAENGWSPSLRSDVMEVASTVYATDQCEHIIAKASLRNTPEDVIELSKALKETISLCDFREEHLSKKTMKKSIDDLLEVELDLLP